MSAKQTVLIISIFEVIAIIVIIVSDIFVATVVPDDDHVPGSQESYEEPRDDPSGQVQAPANLQHLLFLLRMTPCDPGWRMETPQRRTGRTPMAIPCRLRFWNIASECNIAADDVGPCMGIELNLWDRAKVSFQVAIIRTIIIIVVIDIFSIDIMIFQFCTGPALHSAHVGGLWRPA